MITECIDRHLIAGLQVLGPPGVRNEIYALGRTLGVDYLPAGGCIDEARHL